MEKRFNDTSKTIYNPEENKNPPYAGFDGQEPGRNYLCPEYEWCLDRAAKENLSMLCAYCVNKNKKRSEFLLSIPEIQGCMDLVRVIFFPTRFLT